MGYMLSRRLYRTLSLAIPAVALLTVTACGNSETDPTSTETSVATSTETETATSTATNTPTSDTTSASPTSEAPESESPKPESPLGTPKLATARSMPVSSPGDPAALTVTNIRVAEHSGFDRLVFDLEGTGKPGWLVRYVDQPLQQASGHRVNVDGQSYLEVNVEGVTYNLSDRGPQDLLTGVQDSTKRRAAGINQVYYAGAFEARGQYFAGLNHPATAFSVTYLEAPKRLVIDITHNQ